MASPTSPHTVFESLLQGITGGSWDQLADLYAEDAVVEMPFAPQPPRRLQGREALRAHFAAAAGGPLKLQASNVVVHDTADPVRDGRIVSSRDYHDHLAIAAALGRPPEPTSSPAEWASA